MTPSNKGTVMFEVDDKPADLSGREREILELVAHGESSKQIAKDIGIAPRTVERHVENIRHKLRARNKTHLIAKAISFGMLHVGRSDRQPDSNLLRFKPKVVND